MAIPSYTPCVQDILEDIWSIEEMPDEFCDPRIVAPYKNKGSKLDCRNYKVISVLSIAELIFACILLNRPVAVFERNLPEAQCGFQYSRHGICQEAKLEKVHQAEQSSLLCLH